MKNTNKKEKSYKQKGEVRVKYDWRKHLKPKRSPKQIDLEMVNSYLNQLKNAFLQCKELTGKITTEDVTYNINVVKRILNK